MFLSWPKCYAKIISSARWWVGSWQLNKTLFLSVKDEDKKWISFRGETLCRTEKFHISLQTCAFCRVHTYAQSRHDGSSLPRRWCISACSRHSWVYVVKDVRASRVKVTHTDQPQHWNIGEVSDVLAHLGRVTITLPAGWILSLIQFEDFGEQVSKPRLPLVPGETAGTGARHHFYQTPHYWLPKVRVGFFIWVVGCYCNPNPIFVGSTLTELCIVTR